jgi:iron complex outermembrane receptor protein
VLNQLETFQSTGIYILQDFLPLERLLLSFCIRYDDLKLKATDYYLPDGDQSGNRRFKKINPNAGLNFKILKNIALYANYASTFESPTLNELSNNPSNTGGFNPSLAPQQAQSFEIGSKGKLTEGVRYDVAIFKINTENDLVPYQIAGQTGKTFFRNAGKTTRTGIEIALNAAITEGVAAHIAYTYSDFKYKTYSVNTTSFDGKILPGIPQHHVWLELRYNHPKGFFGIVQSRLVDKIYANDANTAFADGYTIVNTRIGYILSAKQVQIEPFFAINNLFNRHYVANVQLNAASDRYFEPAALQYFYGGLKVRFGE